MSSILKIQHLRGSASDWTSRNPVLPEGEIGVEIDTLKIKVGNGTDTWTNLAYVGDHVSTAAGANEITHSFTMVLGVSDYEYTWTHNLGSRISVHILDSNNEEVEVQITHNSTNQLTLNTNDALSGTIVATY